MLGLRKHLVKNVRQSAFIAAACRGQLLKPYIGFGKLAVSCGYCRDLRGMNDAVENQFIDLGNNADIARNQFADFCSFLTLKNHRVRNLPVAFLLSPTKSKSSRRIVPDEF